RDADALVERLDPEGGLDAVRSLVGQDRLDRELEVVHPVVREIALRREPTQREPHKHQKALLVGQGKDNGITHGRVTHGAVVQTSADKAEGLVPGSNRSTWT